MRLTRDVLCGCQKHAANHVHSLHSAETAYRDCPINMYLNVYSTTQV